MAVFAIPAVLAFDILFCMAEVPKMLKNKLYRELTVYSVLLILGTVLAILKSLKITIPNPSDFVAWAYAPISKLIQNFLLQS